MIRKTTKGRRQWMVIVVAATALASGPAHADRGSESARVLTHGIQNNKTRPVSYQSWDDASRQTRSPEDVCKAVTSRVQYSRDMLPEDEWRTGKDTWNKGEGDCEDFAAAVKDLSQEKGFKADVYVVHSKTAGESHAVTIGESNGTIWISSNGSYEEVQSINDAKEKLARDLGWWAPDMDVYKVEKESANNTYRREVITASNTGR